MTLFGAEAVRVEAAANSQEPRNIEPPAGSGDSFLERLGAVGRPVVLVARNLDTPVGHWSRVLVESEGGREVGASPTAWSRP